jgi:hypothetical protein
MLNTGIWRPGANRPDKYDRPGAPPKEGRDGLSAYLERARAAGMEVKFAPLEEVADICFEGIKNDTFWITVPSQSSPRRSRPGPPPRSSRPPRSTCWPRAPT